MNDIMKKLWFKVVVYFNYIFYGLRGADNVIFSAGGKDGDGGINAESRIQNEQKKVYEDLLRGEVTEEVKELRHEMYLAERESKKYTYSGGGKAKKRKSIFAYQGDAYNPKNDKIILVQENKEDTGGVLSDLDPNKQRSFVFSIERDFIPTMKIEEYSKKVVLLKDEENDELLFDIYFDNYVRQFDRRHRIFYNELNRVHDGDRQSELLDFNTFSFTAKNAFGSEDLVEHTFSNFKFLSCVKYNGSIIFRFRCKKKNEHDIFNEVFHKPTDEKIKNKEKRKFYKEKPIDYLEEINKDNKYNDEALNLINNDRKDNN